MHKDSCFVRLDRHGPRGAEREVLDVMAAGKMQHGNLLGGVSPTMQPCLVECGSLLEFNEDEDSLVASRWQVVLGSRLGEGMHPYHHRVVSYRGFQRWAAFNQRLNRAVLPACPKWLRCL